MIHPNNFKSKQVDSQKSLPNPPKKSSLQSWISIFVFCLVFPGLMVLFGFLIFITATPNNTSNWFNSDILIILALVVPLPLSILISGFASSLAMDLLQEMEEKKQRKIKDDLLDQRLR